MILIIMSYIYQYSRISCTVPMYRILVFSMPSSTYDTRYQVVDNQIFTVHTCYVRVRIIPYRQRRKFEIHDVIICRLQ